MKAVVKDGFICCSNCNRKTITKIHDDTFAINLPAYCKFCKKETIVNVGETKITQSESLMNQMLKSAT